MKRLFQGHEVALTRHLRVAVMVEVTMEGDVGGFQRSALQPIFGSALRAPTPIFLSALHAPTKKELLQLDLRIGAPRSTYIFI